MAGCSPTRDLHDVGYSCPCTIPRVHAQEWRWRYITMLSYTRQQLVVRWNNMWLPEIEIRSSSAEASHCSCCTVLIYFWDSWLIITQFLIIVSQLNDGFKQWFTWQHHNTLHVYLLHWGQIGKSFWLVFGRSPVRISAMTPNILTEVSFLQIFFRLFSKISAFNYETWATFHAFQIQHWPSSKHSTLYNVRHWKRR
jgi:hypothetical protein